MRRAARVRPQETSEVFRDFGSLAGKIPLAARLSDSRGSDLSIQEEFTDSHGNARVHTGDLAPD